MAMASTGKITWSTKDFKLEVKEYGANKDLALFTGMASVYNVRDLQGDIVQPGAFKRTLDHKKGKVPLLWQHDMREPIGKGYLEDTPDGLQIHGEILTSIPEGYKAYQLIKNQIIDGLSIGYDVVQDGWEPETRLLKELRLWEVSLVTVPACPVATVTNVKSAIPYADLVVKEAPWNEGEAVQRIQAWATVDGKLSPVKLSKAFLYHEENIEDIKSYKLPIADVVNGELVMLPAAVDNAAKQLLTGKVAAPGTELDAIQDTITRYYQKMGRKSPFEKDAKTAMQLALYNVLGATKFANPETNAEGIEGVDEDTLNTIKQVIDQLQSLLTRAEQNAVAPVALAGTNIPVAAQTVKSADEAATQGLDKTDSDPAYLSLKKEIQDMRERAKALRERK